jgi:predicted nucleotidyltransferase
MSKYKRAEMATDCGADIVLELPFPWSASYAQSFARAGVSVAENLGSIDYLAFGSESSDENYITDCAEKLSSSEFENELSKSLSDYKNTSRSYAELRSETFEKMYGRELSRKPNDILALEYISAIKFFKSDIKPLFIKRYKDFSATESRKHISSFDNESLEKCVPAEIFEKTVSAPKFSPNISDAAGILFLAYADPEKISNAPEMSFDLASRLVNAARSGKFKTLSSLFDAVATKKYTDARIRRAFNFAFLGVTKEDISSMPEYTVVLASSSEGRNALREFSKSAKINVIATKSAHNKFSDLTEKQYRIMEKADLAYSFQGEMTENEGIKPYIKD